MSKHDNLRPVILSFFAKKDASGLADDDNLFARGLLDSMEVLELIHHLETSFGVEVEPEEISEENFKTLGAIAALIEGKL